MDHNHKEYGLVKIGDVQKFISVRMGKMEWIEETVDITTIQDGNFKKDAIAGYKPVIEENPDTPKE